VQIDEHVIPSGRRGPGQPKNLSDAELVCLAVAQVLLGARSEHHWLRLCDARIRQWIESVNDTLKGQLDLERHGGRTTEGVYARIAQRMLAMAAAIWHNWAAGAPVKRSLITYDN
jgi:hypothetical protein